MTEKKHISATVDPAVKAHLDQDGVNASGLINTLVKREMAIEGENIELVKLRLEQVKSERESLENRLEDKRAQEERLEKRLESLREEEQSHFEEAQEALHGAELDPSNPAVKNWAEKVGVTPEELIEEIETNDA